MALQGKAIIQRGSSSTRHLASSGKPWHAEHLAAPQGGAVIEGGLTKRQKRIIYRSGQRGWLELDILMGRWAASHVPNITDEAELTAIERLLDAETPHLLQWVLGHSEPPSDMDTPTFKGIRRYVAEGQPRTGTN